MPILFVFAAIVTGSALQRLTGMGFALVAAPFLGLLLGPFDGVLVTNVCSALAAAILFSVSWARVDWVRLRAMMPSALVGIVPGAWLAANVAHELLDLVIGIIVLVGISTSFLSRRLGRMHGFAPMVGFGFASGFMNATAGVGGPALSAYAVMTRWQQVSLAATLQPMFFTMGIVSVVAKSITGPPLWEVMPLWQWLAMTTMVGVGTVIGSWLARFVSPLWSRRALIALAYLGSVIIVIRGSVGLAMQGVWE